MHASLGQCVREPRTDPCCPFQDVPKVHNLERRLHTFSMFGMPRLPPEDRRHWEIGEGGDSGLNIEKSWKELVPEHKVTAPL